MSEYTLLPERNRMNINVTKVKATRGDCPVIIFETSDKIYGKYQRDGIWYAYTWPLSGRRYPFENEIDLVESKTWRAFKRFEAPLWVMVRGVKSGEVKAHLTHGHSAQQLSQLFEDVERIHGDGSATPFGVCE